MKHDIHLIYVLKNAFKSLLVYIIKSFTGSQTLDLSDIILYFLKQLERNKKFTSHKDI